MAVMEGEAAVGAVHGPALDAAKKAGVDPSPEVLESAAQMRADYETQLDARYAAARGFVDTICYPEDTRTILALALRAAAQNSGPHLGAFVLPPMPTYGAPVPGMEY